MSGAARLLACLSAVVINVQAGSVALAGRPTPPDTITVVAEGTGLDEDAALRQAFRNAIQQAVGTIVEAETVVKNEEVIMEKILTASNAIVSKYERLDPPKAEPGVVTVRIRAQVERRVLTERLEKASVVSKAVDGEDLFAKAVTGLEKERDAARVIRRAFDGFPGNVLRAEPVGEPRVISKTDAEVTVGVTVKFSMDMEKYDRWRAAFLPVLSRLATKANVVRWDPKSAGARPLSTKDRNLLKSGITGGSSPQSGSALAVPDDELPRSYAFGDRSTRFSEQTLAVFERAGSSKVQVLHFDDPAFRELRVAASAVPWTEVVLKAADGDELDAQESAVAFGSRTSQSGWVIASPFWVSHPDPLDRRGRGPETGQIRGTFLPPNVDYSQWRPDERALESKDALMIFPYMCASQTVALSAFTKEFAFTIPADRLRQIKFVEAKVSSRLNLAATD